MDMFTPVQTCESVRTNKANRRQQIADRRRRQQIVPRARAPPTRVLLPRVAAHLLDHLLPARLRLAQILTIPDPHHQDPREGPRSGVAEPRPTPSASVLPCPAAPPLLPRCPSQQ